MSIDRPFALEELEVDEVPDGLIVYDALRDRVHHLNATAAVVFALCDGEHDIPTIAGLVAAAFGLERPPYAEVQTCVRDFAEQGLLG